MVSEKHNILFFMSWPIVLILVLVEDGFWVVEEERQIIKVATVLILVLVEDGFWDKFRELDKSASRTVLILVLVEDGFWDLQGETYGNEGQVLILVLVEDGFWDICNIQYCDGVLILVLVEDGFWDGEPVDFKPLAEES